MRDIMCDVITLEAEDIDPPKKCIWGLGLYSLGSGAFGYI